MPAVTGGHYSLKGAEMIRTDLPASDDMGKWWATLESNQAWVSPAELQSAAAPCSTSPAEPSASGVV